MIPVDHIWYFFSMIEFHLNRYRPSSSQRTWCLKRVSQDIYKSIWLTFPSSERPIGCPRIFSSKWTVQPFECTANIECIVCRISQVHYAVLFRSSLVNLSRHIPRFTWSPCASPASLWVSAPRSFWAIPPMDSSKVSFDSSLRCKCDVPNGGTSRTFRVFSVCDLCPQPENRCEREYNHYQTTNPMT